MIYKIKISNVCKRFEGEKHISRIKLTKRLFRKPPPNKLYVCVPWRKSAVNTWIPWVWDELTVWASVQTCWRRFSQCENAIGVFVFSKIVARLFIWLGQEACFWICTSGGKGLIRHTFLWFHTVLPESFYCWSESRQTEGILWYSAELLKENSLFSCQRVQRSGLASAQRPQSWYGFFVLLKDNTSDMVSQVQVLCCCTLPFSALVTHQAKAFRQYGNNRKQMCKQKECQI